MPTPGTPLPAALIPDCTKPEAHHAAYKSAKANDAIFVCIARQGPRWMVELDAFASSGPTIPDQAVAVLHTAVEALVSDGTVTQANMAPDYISMRALRVRSAPSATALVRGMIQVADGAATGR
ncbi:hypothetical protein [Streptomyces canus]|uniref:hypothetical protein n=1 Tax=Streptomyces canus TaxID=58343 RepID=UPI0030E56FF4